MENTTITEENLTQLVLDTNNAANPRTKQLLDKLINHLHAFIKDAEPTQEEWLRAIQFLTNTGHTCDGKRQEFILLSDVLGVSMLVDAVNHRYSEDVTESTVTGPFHTDAKPFPMGENIAKGDEAGRGAPTIVRGTIRDEQGKPIKNALVDVWQCDDLGYYDIQDVNQPEQNLRGLFETSEDGRFWFKTIKPAAYPIPNDGPVGDLLQTMQRSPMRPAHIHFWIQAKGHEDLITHLFVEGDEYIASDAVFGVKETLILPFVLNEDSEAAEKWNVPSPFYDVAYDFTLAHSKS